MLFEIYDFKFKSFPLGLGFFLNNMFYDMYLCLSICHYKTHSVVLVYIKFVFVKRLIYCPGDTGYILDR